MASTLHLEIVTPDAKMFDDEVDMVVLPGMEGEMGIYPLHVPLMTRLKPGELRVLKNGRETAMVVGDGFVEITQTRVAVMTDLAIEESDIDENAVVKAIERAEASMRERQLLNDEEIALVESTLERSLAQLHFKRRKGA